MAYGTKYRLQWASRNRDYRLSLQQEGYTGAVTNLNSGPTPFEVEWGGQGQERVPVGPLVSTAKVQVRGDTVGEQVLEVFDTPATEWRVEFEGDPGGGHELLWRGFASEVGKDNPHGETEVIQIDALDGLALLENKAMSWSGGSPYEAARSVLNALSGLDLAASMEWYPYRDGNQLSASEQPMDKLTLDELAFDEIELLEGEGFESIGALDERESLEAVLRRFGLELFQSEGEWWMRQPGRVQSDGTVKTWPSQSAVTSDNPETRDVSAELPFRADAGPPRDRTERVREVQSVHEYRNLGELVKNGSFEGPNGNGSLDGWTGGTVKDYSNVSYLNEQATQEDTYVATFDGSTISQDVPAILHDAGPRAALQLTWDFVQTEASDPRSLWAETRIALDGTWYVQGRQVDVADDTDPADNGTIPLSSSLPGAGDTIVIPAGATLPVFDTVGGVTQSRVTLTEPARAGADALQAKIPNSISSGDYLIFWVWSDTQTSHSDSGSTVDYWGLYVESKDYPGAIGGTTLKEQSIKIPTHAPDGTGLSEKDLSITVEMDTGAAGYLDHASAELVKNDRAIEQTSYTLVDDQSGRSIKLGHRLGDGPTASHPKSIGLSGVDVTQDWKVGAYSGGSRSGKLLEQLTAEEILRRTRLTRPRYTYEGRIFDGEEVWPSSAFDIGGHRYLVSYLRRSFGADGDRFKMEIEKLTDAGTLGVERAYSMEAGEGAGGLGGSRSLVQRVSGGATSWDELVGKPSGLLTRDGDADDYGETTAPAPQDIASALSHSPGLADGIQTSVREEGSATDEALVTEQGIKAYVDESGVNVDLGDDGTTEITALQQISVVGDTDDIFSVGNETKEVAINAQKKWPNADKLDGYESGAFVPGTGSNLRVTTSLPNPKVQTVTHPTFGQVTLNNQAAALDESVRADRSLAGGEGIQPVGDLTQDREVAVDDTVARTDRNETFDKDVTVIGDFFVEGQETVLNTQTVETTDNLIFLNAGQQGAGVTSGFAGFEADRGTEEPVKLVFDEVTDLGRVGIHYKTLSYSGTTRH